MKPPANAASIRATHALCPTCLRTVPAEVVEEDGEIRLVKRCHAHGESRTFLSAHPGYYRDLNRFYFTVMDRSHAQRDYILRMTERCNLECPICLAGANQAPLADFTPADVARLVRRFRGKKVDLMGCEPTVMPDLPEILRIIAASGNISALHSNGVALADPDYVRRLKEAGLDEVHLQFDALRDGPYQVIRGQPLLDTKLKAMDNLAAHNIPVDLVMTVLAGVNEDEIAGVLDYGLKHPNVKEVFFLGCRMLGRASQGFDSRQLLPDQVIDLVDAATAGRVSRDAVRRFQKLYFALLSVFGVRKCLYIQHYLLLRGRDGEYRTLDDVVDMPRLERILERYRERRERGRRWAAPLLGLESLPVFLTPAALRLAGDFLALSVMMGLGFNLRRARRRSVMLGYITACDPHIYDAAVAENCGKGEISRDLGVQESGALANVLREHRWRAPVIRILSPSNSAAETRQVIEAGANEIYCGVMPRAWKKSYSSSASPNRREWQVSNMTEFSELGESVRAAHALKVPVFMTLNALYTEKQYPQVREMVREAHACGVDAVIVADLGLLLSLREMGWERAIHISTGGTAFNRETVDFYRSLGAARVIIPRHNRVAEVAQIARANPDLEIEAFILNRGCMNIDGFCTFQHGTNELRRPLLWSLPKKLHLDIAMFSLMSRFPAGLRALLGRSRWMAPDSACLLPYEVEVRSAGAAADRGSALRANLRRNFNVFSGSDTCGACALWDFDKAGVCSIKIVGRENALPKKLRDVGFLKACRDQIARSASRADFAAFAQDEYRRWYGHACRQWCYFPAEDSAIPAGEM